MKLSLVIPARNEAASIESVVSEALLVLEDLGLDFEMILVDDNSTDNSGQIMERLATVYPNVRVIHRRASPGFGNALRDGFRHARGDVVIPLMGDRSDDPRDIEKMVNGFRLGYGLVVGSRFIRGGLAEGYPLIKLIINRGFNLLVRFLFRFPASDITNAFKAYARAAITAVEIHSEGFEITVELPLRVFLAGCRVLEVPVSWRGRRSGVSKLRLPQMGPKYVRTVLTILQERRTIRLNRLVSDRSK